LEQLGDIRSFVRIDRMQLGDQIGFARESTVCLALRSDRSLMVS
jgi:hypothetical protein